MLRVGSEKSLQAAFGTYNEPYQSVRMITKYKSWFGHKVGNKKAAAYQNNLPIIMINPREVNGRNLNSASIINKQAFE